MPLAGKHVSSNSPNPTASGSCSLDPVGVWQAQRTVSRLMWGLSGAVVCGAGGYWYLSYVYFSWDIMVGLRGMRDPSF